MVRSIWMAGALLAGIVSAAEPVTIGIVRDGTSWYAEQITTTICDELRILTEGEFDVRFKDGPEFNAGFDLEEVPHVFAAALNDDEVDILLLMGVMATRTAAHYDAALNKPVVGGFVLDADIFGLPYSADQRSTRTNFTYVVSTERSLKDVDAFHRMIPFQRLHIVVDSFLYEGVPRLADPDYQTNPRHGFPIAYITSDGTAASVLDKLGPDVEALYLTPPVQMSEPAWQALIDGINERGIPSFALRGMMDVERGVLAGLLPFKIRALGRRVALNLQQVMLGTAPESLPVFLPIQDKLVVNARTANQIGYSPDFQTLLSAELLNVDDLRQGEVLTLEAAMQMAADHNVSLAIARASVETARQDRLRSRSALLPRVEGTAGYVRIDEDRAEGSMGTAAEERTTVGLTARQVLYDDEAWTGFRSADRNVARLEYELATTELDAMAEAGNRFLGFLLARALLRVELDNLRLTESNLELARTRFQVGSSGAEDVHRWEAQDARQRSDALAAEAELLAARYLLNQTLGVDPHTAWIPQDIELADDDFYFLQEFDLAALVNNYQQLDALRRFAVIVAEENAPELKSLDQAIAAQRLALGQRRRAYYVPSVVAGFSYDHTIDESYAAAAPPPTEDDEWSATVTASLPLLESGGRAHDVSGARSELERLLQTRERARQLVEQQTLLTTAAMDRSQPNIQLSRRAAASARKNLDIVRDKYARGAASIIELLDAQSQAFAQDQAAAVAGYEFLQDVIDFQRSLAWFERFGSEESRAAWVRRLKAYLAERGLDHGLHRTPPGATP